LPCYFHTPWSSVWHCRPVAMMTSPKIIAKALLTLAATVSGLQQNAGKEQLATIELGNSVPISETGYQQVAAQKSDEEMKAFIHRVVAKEARYVKDVSELSGLVGFYSGTQGVQDLESLKKELRASSWVAEGEGRTAPLTDFGYQKVAALKSNAHMMAFARRILSLNSKVCSDEGALTGLIPYYSGEVAVQSFDQLTHELLSAPWAVAPGAIALAEKKEDPEPEPVETTLAATTTVVTTTVATTTLATTTLATTTLATTTVLTTLVTTTLPEEEEEEVEEALLEDLAVVSKHNHDVEEGVDDLDNEETTKEKKADQDEEHDGDADSSKEDEPKAKKTEKAKAHEDDENKKDVAKAEKTSSNTGAEANEKKDHKSNATKESKTNATKDATKHAANAKKDVKSKATKESSEKSKDSKKGKNSWFGWLTR